MIYLGTYNDMIDPEETTVIHDYVSELIEKVKEYKECSAIVPFIITDIRAAGFMVKVSGLYAYIHFRDMPWRYSHLSEWRTIYPELIGKTFLCQIYEIRENPLNIKVNGAIPQFQKPCFLIDQQYKGIITRKFHDGLFLDLGYDFDWQCGSIISPIFKHNLIQENIFEGADEIPTFDELEVGQILEVSYWGIDRLNNKILGNDIGQKKWNTGEIMEYRKQLVNVTVTIEEGTEKIYSVENTNDAEMPILKLIYGREAGNIRKAIALLKDQDVIKCEVSRILTEQRKFLLKWDDYEEIKNILSREKEIATDTDNTELNLVEQQIPKPRKKIAKPARVVRVAKPATQTLEKPMKEVAAQETPPVEKPIKRVSAQENPLIGSVVMAKVIKNINALGSSQNTYTFANSNEYKPQLYIYNPNYRITEYEKLKIEKYLAHNTILECKVLTIEDDIIMLRWSITDKELKTFLQ